MIWNSIPTTTGTPATGVFGQSDFNSAVSNSGGLSASSLSYPYGLIGDGAKLFIGDPSNKRTLVTPIPN
ncbi:MAG: hypothetical protein NT027_09360 [Proteobacteria bacterium]|nr:hypothetical protein [Pseudomonadota bacterium]